MSKPQPRPSPIDPPRFVDGKLMLIAGLTERYNGDNSGIPSQWQRFMPHIGRIPGQVGHATYGIVFDALPGTMNFGYLTGVEVNCADYLPEGFGHLEIPAQRYAVFVHRGHVAEIPHTMRAIFGEWLPHFGCEHAPDGVELFERYGEEFDPRTGLGGFEIWLPLKA